MKNIKLIILALLVLFSEVAFSQTSYFSSKELIPLYTPFHSGVDDDQTIRRVYFDLSEVNNTNGRLDLVGGVSEYQLKVIPTINYYDVNGSLYLNSNDSNFNDLSSTFTSQNLAINGGDPGGYNRIRDILFAHLRSSAKKDVVVMRDSNICVYRNTSGNINIKLDSISILDSKNLTIGNFNYQDELDDVIIFHNDTIKIFKSIGDGTLDHTSIQVIYHTNIITKIISKQVNLENEPFRSIQYPNGVSNKDEIIFSSEDNIYFYTNSNNNSFTYSQTVSFSEDVIDFEIADINNDGWNDLLAVGQNLDASSRYMKVFLNNGGGTISSTAIFSITTNVIRDCKISTGDFNKDGWNDIVMGGRDTIRVFENIKGSNLFSTSNTVNFIYNTPTISLPKKIIVTDLTNLGGLSVLFSGKTQTLYESDPGWIYENILRMNPSVKDANPAPAYIFTSTATVDSVVYPKLLLYSRGDRDFNKFKIYKLSQKTGYTWAFIDSTAANSYTDYNEVTNIYSTDPPPSPNCFYYAKVVDNSYHTSIASDTVSFRVGTFGCGTCEDNLNSWDKNGIPREYSLKQNYPNPFNPSTNIQYDLPNDNFVTIKIYNILGREEVTIVNEFKKAGSYSIVFNSNNLSSGIYYYKIEAGSFIQTKKMLLIK